jgi:hypothetical protein
VKAGVPGTMKCMAIEEKADDGEGLLLMKFKS